MGDLVDADFRYRALELFEWQRRSLNTKDWQNLVAQCKDWLERVQQRGQASTMDTEISVVKGIFNRELRQLKKLRRWTQRVKRTTLDLALKQ